MVVCSPTQMPVNGTKGLTLTTPLLARFRSRGPGLHSELAFTTPSFTTPNQDLHMLKYAKATPFRTPPHPLSLATTTARDSLALLSSPLLSKLEVPSPRIGTRSGLTPTDLRYISSQLRLWTQKGAHSIRFIQLTYLASCGGSSCDGVNARSLKWVCFFGARNSDLTTNAWHVSRSSRSTKLVSCQALSLTASGVPGK